MAEWFFRKKSKGEVERDPGWDGCCIATCPVARNRSWGITCLAIEKLVRGGLLAYGN